MVIPRMAAALTFFVPWVWAAMVTGSLGMGAPQGAGGSQVSLGRHLVNELRCGACHGDLGTGRGHLLPAPDLGEVGTRLRPEFLARYLSDPQAAQPGSSMPQLLLGAEGSERDELVMDLWAFLVDRGSEMGEAPGASGEPGESAPSGEGLFHQVGCVACHAPRRSPSEVEELPAPQADAIDLGHVPAKYTRASLASFLFHPEAARPAGRMPDMGLSRGESDALAEYLLGDAAPGDGTFDGRVTSERVARGKGHYEALACASCHESEMGFAPAAAATLGAMNLEAGCLDPADRATPRYDLDEEQRAAIAAYLSEPGPAATDELRIAEMLTANRCLACHDRGALEGASDGSKWGGVPAALDPYFATDEPDLGDEARLPPSLHLVGARLRTEWLRGVMFRGQGVRPYMHTRMPRFVERELGELPGLLASVDRVEPYPMAAATGREGGEQREAGRELLGTTGLGCIMCHDFNGKPSPGFGGIDLVTTAERLQPDWFARFLIEPQRYRPGIVMPESWSGGEAAHQGILDGDTPAQIAAIWYFLEQGRTARNPKGIDQVPTFLEVEDETLTYRGRSSVAGFRGIAVGAPLGVHYAFDAQNGSLSGFWLGDFLSVNWSGQGAGNFHPRGRFTALPRDLTFHRLGSPQDPWPLLPVRDMENPSKDKRGNPDPAYPRNLGYRFLGYYFDSDRVPTLRYTSGEVRISDRSIAYGVIDPSTLRRTLTFEAPEAETLYMRVLAGEITARPAEEGGPAVFRSGGVQVTIRPVEALQPPVLRPITEGNETEQELLLPLALPQGVTQLEIDYAILP